MKRLACGMNILFFMLFGLALTGLIELCPPVQAQSEPSRGKVLLIMDASGSMWGRVEKKQKIIVAREVMTNLIKELPEQIDVGLQTYGHRSKGDCEDIELMVKPGEASRDAVIEKIQSIMPKGKTPITKSFELAGKTLEGGEEETTVVLISDGKETCGGDPCTLVRSLRERGIKVRVHVVGFDVSQEERKQLICIADAGKGKYFTADNADQLKEALTEVKQEIVAATEVKEPAPKIEAGLRVRTVLVEGGESLAKDLSYEVYHAEKDLEGRRKRVSYSYDAEPRFKLAAGQYHVTVKYGNATAEAEISVQEGQLVEQTLVLNAGYLRLQSIPVEGAEPLEKDLSYEVLRSKKGLEGRGKRISYSYDARPLFRLPAGRYRAEVKHGNSFASSEVEVSANELTESTLNLNVGYLRLKSIPAEGAEPLKKELSYEVYYVKKDLEGSRKQISYSYDPTPLFKLPAGQYLVLVKHGNTTTRAEISVTANELTEHTLNLNVGYLKLLTVAAQGMEPLKQPLQYQIYSSKKDLEGKRKRLVQRKGSEPLFKLAAGKYHVVVKEGKASSGEDVEVVAGELTEHTLNLNMGYLRLQAVAGDGAEPLKKRLKYQLFSAKKNLESKRARIDSYTGNEPLFKLHPGQYYVTVKDGKNVAEAEVEVTAGELTEATVNFSED